MLWVFLYLYMKQIFLTHIAFLSTLGLFGQIPLKLFNETRTIEQAKKLIESYPKSEAKLFTIVSDKDTSDILLPLFDKKTGYTFKIDNYLYKIIDTNSYPEFRASYIYLDGNQLSPKELDSTRIIIMTKFKNGAPFYELVREYTMDGNPTGDLGWFTENAMVKDFEMAVKKHTKGDIFTVDIPENKWHYVTFKTFDNRITKKITLLKIKK